MIVEGWDGGISNIDQERAASSARGVERRADFGGASRL